VLAGFPVLAQVGAFPPTEPAQQERLPTAEPEPTQAAPPSPPTGGPSIPASPFGLSPETFPGVVSGRPPPTGAPPFGLSPDIFPGILGGRPDRRTPEQPAIPSSEPGISPGISPGTSPGIPTAPAATPSEAAPSPEPGAPVQPQPGLATTPDLVSPFVTSPYGFGNLPTLLPPSPGPVATPTSLPPSTALAPLGPAVLPTQAYDLRAPPIVVGSAVSVSGGYTDNANSTPQKSPSAYARLGGSTVISVDTVRLQGQLSGGINYVNYARDTNQNSLDANLAAFGLGTVVQDHIFIDGRAAITQFSPIGGLGFAGPQLISRSQKTQLITTSVAPIARYSFGGYVDSELRYNYAMSLFDQGSLFGGSGKTGPSTTNLSNATANEVTLALASGRMFTYFGSRLTLDALKFDSDSSAQSTQLRAVETLEYPFNQKFAGLGLLGYENLRFPLQPGANFIGPSWSIGGRYTPFEGSYFIGSYGSLEGLPGFSGALRYEITPLTALLASAGRNRGSQQQQIIKNLNSATVNASGNVVNQVTGLPVALVNPQSALSNGIFEFETARAD